MACFRSLVAASILANTSGESLMAPACDAWVHECVADIPTIAVRCEGKIDDGHTSDRQSTALHAEESLCKNLHKIIIIEK